MKLSSQTYSTKIAFIQSSASGALFQDENNNQKLDLGEKFIARQDFDGENWSPISRFELQDRLNGKESATLEDLDLQIHTNLRNGLIIHSSSGDSVENIRPFFGPLKRYSKDSHTGTQISLSDTGASITQFGEKEKGLKFSFG